jgi:hypothetical protein
VELELLDKDLLAEMHFLEGAEVGAVAPLRLDQLQHLEMAEMAVLVYLARLLDLL